MSAMASQITSLMIVYSTVYSGGDQRKHQSSASLAFVRGIHRWPMNSPHKWPVTRKMFPFDDVIMFIGAGPRLETTLTTNWFGWNRFRGPSMIKLHIIIFITRDSEVIMFSPCVFVCLFVCVCLCLSRCLSGRFNYEGLVPHKQYFAGTLLGMSICASYVSRTHDVIDDVTRSQIRSNFEIDISPSIFELERWSKAQNVGNANGYLSDIFNFWYNFR